MHILYHNVPRYVIFTHHHHSSLHTCWQRLPPVMPLERRAAVDALGVPNPRDENKQEKDEASESLADDFHSQMAIRQLRDVGHHIRSETRRQMLQLEKSHEIVKHSRGRDDDMEESDEVDIGDEGLDDSYGTSYDHAAARSPPVNSGYLPIPWHGRLGYVSSFQLDPGEDHSPPFPPQPRPGAYNAFTKC